MSEAQTVHSITRAEHHAALRDGLTAALAAITSKKLISNADQLSAVAALAAVLVVFEADEHFRDRLAQARLGAMAREGA
ncbi:MAG: hypothetical protein ACREE4_20595 [Stellaceae bacterium]